MCSAPLLAGISSPALSLQIHSDQPCRLEAAPLEPASDWLEAALP
jgi:hypothetical protein